jgi:hypothetical protein
MPQKEKDFNFLENMVLYDMKDKESIYDGLKAVFDWDDSKINITIASQVCQYIHFSFSFCLQSLRTVTIKRKQRS